MRKYHIHHSSVSRLACYALLAREGERGFAVWDLILGMLLFVPPFSAVVVANNVRPTLAGYATALLSGVILGGGSVWTMWRIGEMVFSRLDRNDLPHGDFWLWVVYISAVASLFIAGIGTAAVTGSVLRHFV